METQILNPCCDFEFPLMKCSQSRRFLVANGINQFQNSDIEMTPVQNSSYTSLKDILSASPTSIGSPVTIRMDSWKEIPIKDPLVQHAAWAYLQPMVELEDDDGRFFVRKMMDKCRGLVGCFNDVVWWWLRAYFPSSSRPRVQDKSG
ncbi:unnamed protein product [Fraxinus pennsylvanica]|uniref:Uncharacterized protein n=1 Tax=Fraxinus pennsylvanica TaxID=56036 RepID=A0AAD2A928_9LAMI|nr:unnamed protein product [Fraxinus pennsylvanica]